MNQLRVHQIQNNIKEERKFIEKYIRCNNSNITLRPEHKSRKIDKVIYNKTNKHVTFNKCILEVIHIESYKTCKSKYIEVQNLTLSIRNKAETKYTCVIK